MNDNVFFGRIEVRPPLNEAERAYLFELAESNSTLRGTPTGRGDKDVPFAHLAWESCAAGCCLTWSAQERSQDLVSSLRFVVDHLLKPDAKAATHRRFRDFTCDHVLDGVVTGKGSDGRVYVVEVIANRVMGRSIASACAQAGWSAAKRSRRQVPQLANVIAFRPRRA